MAEVMIKSFDVNFLLGLNPLYAVPIVAVIVCAIIVYAFGFKAPVQPPSFEAFEEEKKFVKKRKAKDSQKQAKPLQNGKSHSTPGNKTLNASSKKKDVEKRVLTDRTNIEKPISIEKTSATDKNEKKGKKARQQNERKEQEKLKESISQDDIDDGWVQLISKKGRKNRKKDESNVEPQNIAVKLMPKVVETSKSDEGEYIEELTPKSIEPIKDLITDVKVSQQVVSQQEVSQQVSQQVVSQQSEVEEEAQIVDLDLKAPVKNRKIKIEASDLSKLDEKAPIEVVAKEEHGEKSVEIKDESLKNCIDHKVEQGKGKSKKKKKKSPEVSIEVESIVNDNFESSEKETSQIPSSKENISDISSNVMKEAVGDVKPTEAPPETKISNVAFDELAALYPEAKEQRRKKKVRREH